MTPDQQEAIDSILNLKHGECHFFNMFQDGGAVCYKCKNTYLLFGIPLYGGKEGYYGTYHESQVTQLVIEAFSWT